jgi:hypothetical protein
MIHDGVEYGPITQMVVAISPDNGQGITGPTKVCTSWRCQTWHGDTAMGPVLKNDGKNQMWCPLCNANYGLPRGGH